MHGVRWTSYGVQSGCLLSLSKTLMGKSYDSLRPGRPALCRCDAGCLPSVQRKDLSERCFLGIVAPVPSSTLGSPVSPYIARWNPPGIPIGLFLYCSRVESPTVLPCVLPCVIAGRRAGCARSDSGRLCAYFSSLSTFLLLPPQHHRSYLQLPLAYTSILRICLTF